ncbi:13052_t:CDS:2, partial [Dentiscutata erythropus]
TQHILDTMRKTHNQDALLQSKITTKSKKCILNKLDALCEQPKIKKCILNKLDTLCEQPKRRYEEECINVEQDKEIIIDKQNVLISEKYIENTLFKYCKKLPNESLLQSWIIDLDDQEAKELFTIEEWKEI